MLTPLIIFFNYFSRALPLQLTRNGPLSVISSVHVFWSAAQISSLDLPVANTGSPLTSRYARHRGTRSSSVHPRLDPIDLGKLQYTARMAGVSKEGLGGEGGGEKAPAFTTNGAGLGSR